MGRGQAGETDCGLLCAINFAAPVHTADLSWLLARDDCRESSLAGAADKDVRIGVVCTDTESGVGDLRSAEDQPAGETADAEAPAEIEDERVAASACAARACVAQREVTLSPSVPSIIERKATPKGPSRGGLLDPCELASADVLA